LPGRLLGKAAWGEGYASGGLDWQQIIATFAAKRNGRAASALPRVNSQPGSATTTVFAIQRWMT